MDCRRRGVHIQLRSSRAGRRSVRVLRRETAGVTAMLKLRGAQLHSPVQAIDQLDHLITRGGSEISEAVPLQQRSEEAEGSLRKDASRIHSRSDLAVQTIGRFPKQLPWPDWRRAPCCPCCPAPVDWGLRKKACGLNFLATWNLEWAIIARVIPCLSEGSTAAGDGIMRSLCCWTVQKGRQNKCVK
ncbi:hypothetical protein PVAP13_2KG519600 [Panicum virgatum]|uniref:Uncharacterized protein n=1 Tax=Panicum virgatum TaxID=38727 RepID=A0A8T0WFC7_PANVG|nr:hypothetical protein PVAP13_2KG519600 [Panicum virgatum]